MQIASAGVDVLPSWIYAMERVTRAAAVQSPAIADYALGARCGALQ
jgi:hypothetical protein